MKTKTIVISFTLSSLITLFLIASGFSKEGALRKDDIFPAICLIIAIYLLFFALFIFLFSDSDISEKLSKNENTKIDYPEDENIKNPENSS